jgi:hypothetical protein
MVDVFPAAQSVDELTTERILLIFTEHKRESPRASSRGMNRCPFSGACQSVNLFLEPRYSAEL